MKLTFTFFCIFLAALASAQTFQISGQVTDMDSHLPLANASIFLSNSSIGTISDDGGKYRLSLKPGQYELIVKVLGYRPFIRIVNVTDRSQEINAALKPAVFELKEVVIGLASDWKKNYEMFRREFLGNSENALQCKIVNPKVLSFRYDKKNQVLRASADEFLVIENKALGYRLKYLLIDFVRDYRKGTLFWTGKPLFEDITTGERSRRKAGQRRVETYLGSTMHFYRSLAQGKTLENKFRMYGLLRETFRVDSAGGLVRINNSLGIDKNFWAPDSSVSLPGKIKVFQKLIDDTIAVSPPNSQGVSSLFFKNALYVVYKGRRDNNLPTTYRPREVGNYPVSVINRVDEIVFDKNGLLLNPKAVVYEGAWIERIPELLPSDFALPDTR